MAKAEISVVIPCFKQSQFLAGSVQSVLDQEVPAEVIVINDGSPDDTAQVAGRLSGKIQYIQQKNAGQSIARNAGAAAACGKYLIFLDADDQLLPGALKLHMQIARTISGNHVSCGGRRDVNTSGKFLRSHPAPVFPAHPLHALLPSNVAPPACFMLSREAFELAGRFSSDPSLLGHEDWDLWLRIAKHDVPFLTTPGEVAAYRVTGESVSSNIPRMFTSGIRTLRRAKAYHVRCDECSQRIKAGMRLQRQNYANLAFGARLDQAATFSQVRKVLSAAASSIALDPMLSANILKAILLRPWRRGLGARALMNARTAQDRATENEMSSL